MPGMNPEPHGHHHGDASEWDERYDERDQMWSGRPNEALVAEMADAEPGRILDVGCGEGADAVWLAQRGWTVTALDVSEVALDRARQGAGSVGVDVEWIHAGVVEAGLQPASFDLVSVFYPALRKRPGGETERTLFELVAPGGTLLVVYHAEMDAERARAHGFDPADYVLADDMLAATPEGWEVVLDEQRERHVTSGRGADHKLDRIIRLRRRPR